jgi:hypothetical protein
MAHSFTAAVAIGDAIGILDRGSANDAPEAPRSTSPGDACSLPALAL